jgi:acetyl-CoA C-acetyltransferase
VITAALSSQIADGAAALLIASDRAVAEHGLRPKARIAHISARGDDPVLMLTAPIVATERALRKAGLTMADIDLVEINEAFAPVVLAWQRETGADLRRVDICGGAVALGHPLGATGARLMTTCSTAWSELEAVRLADDVRRRQPGQCLIIERLG